MKKTMSKEVGAGGRFDIFLDSVEERPYCSRKVNKSVREKYVQNVITGKNAEVALSQTWKNKSIFLLPLVFPIQEMHVLPHACGVPCMSCIWKTRPIDSRK